MPSAIHSKTQGIQMYLVSRFNQCRWGIHMSEMVITNFNFPDIELNLFITSAATAIA